MIRTGDSVRLARCAGDRHLVPEPLVSQRCGADGVNRQGNSITFVEDATRWPGDDDWWSVSGHRDIAEQRAATNCGRSTIGRSSAVRLPEGCGTVVTAATFLPNQFEIVGLASFQADRPAGPLAAG